VVEEGLTFREVTPATWADLERLFEGRGGPSYCWCMAWRPIDAQADPAARKAAMKAQIDAGTPVGLLAYRGDDPVAWCSIAPRSTYRARMAEVPASDATESVWSVVCFFVIRPLRRQGVFARLLAAAEECARAHGASVLEAYPVAPDSPSYRFGGFLPGFQGFEEVGRAGTRRHVVRRRLD
jgi:GNAT superfamily N-acetyltransferase